MTRKSPQVNQWMTRLPVELDRRESAEDAAKIIAEGGFHHLPIMDGPRLFGVLSSRDLDVVASAGKARELTVGDLCLRDPYRVAPTTPLKDVCEAMLERGIGSAVVVDDKVVVGIFTVTDALRALVAVYSG